VFFFNAKSRSNSMAFIKMIRFPDGSMTAIEQIMRVSVFDNGVGVMGVTGSMDGWLETSKLPEDQQGAAKQKACDILEKLINNPGRAKQPDWSFLDVAPLTTAVQPTRIKPDLAVTDQKRAA
jgi:hypothetical protein